VRWDGDGQHARSDLTAAWLRQDVEASLRRLGVDTIDLLQVHWPCESATPIAETMSVLAELRQAGKIRHVGLCNYDAAELTEAARHGRVDSLQTPYNLLRREFEQTLQPWCLDQAVGALAYEPLCRGLLTGKFNARSHFPDSDLRARDDRFRGPAYLRALTIVSRLDLVARRHKVPVAAVALAWVLRNPAMTGVIAGAKRATQVVENARAAELLDKEELWLEVGRVAGSWRG
jgi:aryl-alcohol dehydrogenase-like predicted oxidoreductase